jgi:hypothetical protein
MPPIGSNTNPTELDRTNDYVERNLAEISDFAGKLDSASERST